MRPFACANLQLLVNLILYDRSDAQRRSWWYLQLWALDAERCARVSDAYHQYGGTESICWCSGNKRHSRWCGVEDTYLALTTVPKPVLQNSPSTAARHCANALKRCLTIWTPKKLYQLAVSGELLIEDSRGKFINNGRTFNIQSASSMYITLTNNLCANGIDCTIG